MTCDMSMVFSGYSSFIHQYNWLPRYNWNITESGVKHHKLNQTTLDTYVACRFSYNFIYLWQVFQIKVTFISYIFLKYMYFKADFVLLYDFIMFRIFVNIVLRGQMSWPIVHFERFHVYITMLHVKGRLFLFLGKFTLFHTNRYFIVFYCWLWKFFYFVMLWLFWGLIQSSLTVSVLW